MRRTLECNHPWTARRAVDSLPAADDAAAPRPDNRYCHFRAETFRPRILLLLKASCPLFFVVVLIYGAMNGFDEPVTVVLVTAMVVILMGTSVANPSAPTNYRTPTAIQKHHEV